MTTPEHFKSRVGREPEMDDMERVNCDKVGTFGHMLCGWCPEHDLPRWHPKCLGRTHEHTDGHYTRSSDGLQTKPD